MADNSIPPPATIIQGAGDWAGYVGAGAANLADPARLQALAQAGFGNMALSQVPSISDAIRESEKQMAAFSNPTQGLNLQSMANMPLSDIARQYGDRAAEGVQSFFTYNPTEKAIDIAQQYARQSTSILSSGGVQQYLGATGDKRFAVYSEVGGEKPFAANVLTDYQKGALGDVFKSGNVAAIAGIRGVESMTTPLIMGAYESFLGPRSPAPTVVQSAQPMKQVEQQQVQPPQGPLNLIGDFFGGFAKSGYAAGAGAIQPFAGSQQYNPVYESLMAKPQEARITGGKVLASVGIETPNYLVDSGEGVKAPFTSASMKAKEQPSTPYTEQALAAVTQRPGYTPIESLGDVHTEQATKAYEMASKAFGLMGMNVATPDLMTGRMLEAQREAAPTTKGQQFFGGELQKWAENKVELASAYHDIGQVSGKPIPANPYEYTGDLAVELLKGAPTKASERFSPASGEMSAVLPTLGGLQGYAWESAKATEKGTAQPAPVSFMQAVNYLGASEGLMGPYGALAGGKGEKYVAPIAATGSAGPGVYLTGEMRTLGGGERLVGGGKVGGEMLITPTEGGEVKAPFTSANLGPATTTIVPSSGELPLVGRLPYISDLLSFVSPQEKITTTSKVTRVPEVSTTVAGEPYTIGGTTFYPSTTTTVGGTKTLETKRSEAYASPLDLFLRQNMPEPSTPEATKVSGVGGTALELLPLIGPMSKTVRSELSTIDILTGGKSEPYTAFVPFSSGYLKDTYTGAYKTPSASLASAALPVALVGLGTGLRVLGAGEGLLAPTTTGGGLYQTASKVASAGFIGLYASDVSKRVLGVTPGEIEQKFLPSMGETGFKSAEGPTSALEAFQKGFPGLEKSRQALNVVETQELAPMTLAFGLSSSIGDAIVGYAKTRAVPEIKNPKASGYQIDEGFPTNPKITTQDLVDSFKSGTITLKEPSELPKTIMAPYGTPIERIPVGTQIGAAPGKSFVYSGAEYPHLKTGFVGEGASELPGMYTSPQRISYFTKAGASQSGGFGITSDILGIYRSPTVFRVSTESGKYQEIPSKLTNAPNPVDPLTGKLYSTNDPLNPKNVAIADWLRTTAEPGVPAIGQYGKSEWQYLIPPGSEVGSARMTGFYRDAGVRIPQYDVEFTGRRSTKYTAPTEKIEPGTGQKLREVGRVYGGVSESVVSSSKQRITPFTPSLTRTSVGSTVTDITSQISRGYSEASSKMSDLSSLITPPKSTLVSTPSKSLPKSSTISTPSSVLYPSSVTYPKSSGASSSRTSDITYPRTTTSFPRSTVTTTPRSTTTNTPTSTTTTKTTTIIIPPPPFPPFSLPGGGTPTGGLRKPGRKFTETLGFFVGPRTNLFAKKKIRGKK